jgi:para-nitrobenzyl esterase
MHGMELPFVFAHPDLVQFMTGMGEDRYELAQRMSASWVAFARSGDPNHAGIPRSEPWNPNRWPTMVFGREVRAVDDPRGDERRAMPAARALPTEDYVPRRDDAHRARTLGLHRRRDIGL